MASPRQIAANQQNALKSTGPNTVEGKMRSRGNSLKHGLAGEGVVLPEAVAADLEERRAMWEEAYEPRTKADAWILEKMAVASARVDEAQKQQAFLKDYEAQRAARMWDRDRFREAHELAKKLKSDPELTVQRLMATKHGVSWLLRRWQRLGKYLEKNGDWNESQQKQALDLLGIPAEFRDELPWGDDPRGCVAGQAAELSQIFQDLDVVDSLARSAAEYSLPIQTSRSQHLLRRYEIQAMNQLHWAQQQFVNRSEPCVEPTSAAAPPSPTPAHEPAMSAAAPSASPLQVQEAQARALAARYESAGRTQTEVLRRGIAAMLREQDHELASSQVSQSEIRTERTPAPAPDSTARRYMERRLREEFANRVPVERSGG